MKEWVKSRAGSRLCRLGITGAALVCAMLVFRLHFQVTFVLGESMLPTLAPGELLLVNRRAYLHADPQRGDIVMARYGRDFILKRVVGLPAEEVEVKHGQLYIDGRAQHEDHPVRQGVLDVGRGKLFEGDFATLGDNRAIPAAVAVHPILSKSDLVGKVVCALGRAAAAQ